MALQTTQNILDTVNQLINQENQPIKATSVPSIQFNMPSGQDMSAQFEKFLSDAANDPKIINYYNQLMQYAQGDADIAKQLLEQDYQTGVRQTTDNMKSNLERLGLTFTGEDQGLQDQLTQRGIAQVDQGNGKNAYATGGEAGNELSKLSQTQQLRQEAEQRSAMQSIENAGLTRQKGYASTDQSLRDQAINFKQSEAGDVTQEAQSNYGIAQQQIATQTQTNQFNASMKAQGLNPDGSPIQQPTAAPAASSPAPSGRSYTVQPGDTLWGIAQKYSGSGGNWGQIGYQGSPTSLKVGTQLNLPW